MSESLDGVAITAAIRNQGAQEQYFRAINRRLLLLGNRLGLDGDFDDNRGQLSTQQTPPAPVGLAVNGVDGSFEITLTLPQDVMPPSVTMYQNSFLRDQNNLRAQMTHQLQSATSVLFDAASNVVTYGPFTETFQKYQIPNATLFWRVRSSYDGTNWNSWVVYSSPVACGPVGVASGFLRSTSGAPNMALNTSNNCTANSVDGGGSATAQIFGPGGVGTAWTHFDGQGGQTSIPAGTIPGLTYNTDYMLLYSPASGYQAYLLLSQYVQSLQDPLIWSAKIHTVSSGGTGGSTGGGGGSAGGTGGGRGLLQ